MVKKHMSPVIQLLVSFRHHGFKISFIFSCKGDEDTNNMQSLFCMSLQFT